MGKTAVERMKELPQSEDLGVYKAEAKRIKAELKLRADITRLTIIDPGTDWYVADVKLFTAPQYQGDSEGFSVTAHYSSNVLSEIFARMKSAEEGIEEFLISSTDHNYKWRKRREVMRCILSLEDQTSHLYDERLKAAEERRLHVYGDKK